MGSTTVKLELQTPAKRVDISTMSRYYDDLRRRNQSSSLWHFNNVDRKQNKVVAEEAHTAIDIAKIDLRIRDNGKVHHTNRYELMEDEEALVLRRGIPFII